MAGINRHTGKVIDNFASAYQSLEVILSTKVGSRVMRREFGGGIIALLGRALTPKLLVAFMQLTAVAINAHEPRFKVRRVRLDGTPEQIRLGQAGFTIELDYRPRAHLGDFRIEKAIDYQIANENN